MQPTRWKGLLCALAIAGVAQAQERRDDPAQVITATPPLRYVSVFADYKPWRDEGSGDWRKVNERVREAAAQAGHAHGGGSAPATGSAKPGALPSTGGKP